MSKTSTAGWEVTYPAYYKFSASADVIAELGWHLLELGVPRLYWVTFPSQKHAVLLCTIDLRHRDRLKQLLRRRDLGNIGRRETISYHPEREEESHLQPFLARYGVARRADGGPEDDQRLVTLAQDGHLYGFVTTRAPEWRAWLDARQARYTAVPLANATAYYLTLDWNHAHRLRQYQGLTTLRPASGVPHDSQEETTHDVAG